MVLVSIVEEDIVAVGSMNKTKIYGTIRAWRHYGSAKIVAVDVRPSVEPQPKGWKSTFKGALDRAVKALNQLEEADYGVGIEAGLLPAPFPSGYMEAQVAVIVDKNDRVSVGISSGFEIPYTMLEHILGGEELGVTAAKRLGRKSIRDTVGLIGILSKGAITRSDLAYQAVLHALIPRMNPGLYGTLKTVVWFKERIEEQIF